MATEDLFQYDPNWPLKGCKRTFDVFTRKEDTLIVDYLIQTKQYSKLGGNEVWKTLSRSKKFNPAGRSYQGLRERFLRYIVKHLHLYSRVTPQIKARFLQQNPKALKDINGMKSTKDLQREFRLAADSDFSDGESDRRDEASGQCENMSLTPVLAERSRLLHALKSNGVSVSLIHGTPCLPASPNRLLQISNQEQVDMDQTLISPSEPLQPNMDDSEICPPGMSGENAALEVEVFEEKYNPRITPDYNGLHITIDADQTFEFHFERLKAEDGHVQIRDLLQLLQDSLRDALFAHLGSLSNGSFDCSGRNTCDGMQLYLELWGDLATFMGRIETYGFRFDCFYLNCFKRVAEEILDTPICVKMSPCHVSSLRFGDIFEYLRSDCAKPFMNVLENAVMLLERLMKDTWKKN